MSFVIFSFRLNSFPLWNWDEAWYAEIIKNMASGKHGYFLPFWNGNYYFDKPPLYFWLSFPIVRAFGTGEWQMRLVGVISASLIIVFTYLIGRHLFGRKAGLFSAIILLSFGQVIFRFSSADLDSLMIFLFLASFYFFLLSPKGNRFSFISGLFLGLSLLVKSWLLGLFPFGLMVSYSLFVDRHYLKFLLSIILIALVAGGWWYLLGSFKYGQEFLRWYVLSPGAGNFDTGIKLSPDYLKNLLSNIGLWLFPVFASLIIQRNKNTSLETKTITVFLVYYLLYFLALHFSRDQFGWYLLPIYPLLAISFSLLLSKLDFSGNKFIYCLIVLSFTGQMFLQYSSFRNDKDRSLIVGELGKFALGKIKPGETIILDDSDFPAFIFYSETGRVLVSQPQGGKPKEYWIISYHELQTYSRPFWLITKDWLNKNLGLPTTIIKGPGGYSLVKFDRSFLRF